MGVQGNLTVPAGVTLELTEDGGIYLLNGRRLTANWGTGGTYTRGGVPQTGGGNIGDTSDTLIVIPAR